MNDIDNQVSNELYDQVCKKLTSRLFRQNRVREVVYNTVRLKLSLLIEFQVKHKVKDKISNELKFILCEKVVDKKAS